VDKVRVAEAALTAVAEAAAKVAAAKVPVDRAAEAKALVARAAAPDPAAMNLMMMVATMTATVRTGLACPVAGTAPVVANPTMQGPRRATFSATSS
jgi:septal ring factor EnvC (AmiA/AmiB activator)